MDPVLLCGCIYVWGAEGTHPGAYIDQWNLTIWYCNPWKYYLEAFCSFPSCKFLFSLSKYGDRCAFSILDLSTFLLFLYFYFILGPLKRTSSWSFDEKLLIQSLYKVFCYTNSICLGIKFLPYFVKYKVKIKCKHYFFFWGRRLQAIAY